MRTLRIPVTVTNAKYLRPTVSTTTTPDPGVLPNQCTLVWKARFDSTILEPSIVNQYVSPNRSYNFVRRTDTPRVRLYVSSDGSAVTSQLATMAGPLNADETRACVVHLNNGSGSQVIQPWTYDGNLGWVAGTSASTATSTLFDSSIPITVGSIAAGTTRIYYVELRTGLDPAAGTVLWRFDANDYPGTGTSYVDPRGRTWTLTSAAAIAANPTNTFVYPVARSVVRVP